MANAYSDILKMIKDVEAAKTPGEEFVVDLNRYIQLSQPKYTPSRSIKPSSLGGCFREQWFMLQGADQDVGALADPGLIGMGQHGNDRHNHLQNACQDAKNYNIPIIWCDPEDEVKRAQSMGIHTVIKRRDGNELLCHNSDYNCNFKCDGIIIYKGIKYILEIKTEDYFKFISRIAPVDKHEFQAAMYCICFGIDRTMFLYEDRNYLVKKGFVSVVPETFRSEVDSRTKHILLYNGTNTVPPKEKGKCTYCRYKQRCKLLGDTVVNTIEELTVKKSKILLAERREAEKKNLEES